MFTATLCSSIARRRGSFCFSAALLLTINLFAAGNLFAQASVSKLVTPATSETPKPSDEPATAPDAKGPLTDKERAELLELIKNLQERVTKLEASQAAGPANASPNQTANAAPKSDSPIYDGSTPATLTEPDPDKKQQDDKKKWGVYTPNLGFKVVDTEYGDMSISIYSYVRYLNQLGLDPSYVDFFGNTKSVQQRHDIQLLKLQIKFLGWIISPKLRYFLYAWTSNANQGQGAQTVLAGNLQYSFNKHITLGGGIRSLPGTRSVEGNFPFWPSVDSRLIADEFMRPSYTSGVWAMGNITDRLEYITMLGNNLSTLGVPAVRIDNGLNTWSSSLVWYPTGNFKDGFSGQAWGDFENHEKFSTRLGFHYSRSDENKESQPSSETFENTQIRLTDGTVIFTPDIFGKDVTITDVRWRMTSFDGGFKYRGFSVEGEYFLRWLDNFRGENVGGVPDIFDHGFQIQGTAMLVPKTVQLYAGHSRIYGDYGKPWDFRSGINFFPFKNKVVRWNTEVLYLHKSPSGYTSVPFAIGGRGWVFHSNFEVAF